MVKSTHKNRHSLRRTLHTVTYSPTLILNITNRRDVVSRVHLYQADSSERNRSRYRRVKLSFFFFSLEGRHICHSVPTDINPDIGVHPCFGKWSISFNEVAIVSYYTPCSLLMAICGFVKFVDDDGSILIWPHHTFRD